ncbi:MAG: hypothetical protein R3B81_14645 [bacterium]
MQRIPRRLHPLVAGLALLLGLAGPAAPQDLSGFTVLERRLEADYDVWTSQSQEFQDSAAAELLDSADDWTTGVLRQASAPWIGNRGFAEMRSDVIAIPEQFRIDVYAFSSAEVTASLDPGSGHWLDDASAHGDAGLGVSLSSFVPLTYLVSGTFWASDGDTAGNGHSGAYAQFGFTQNGVWEFLRFENDQVDVVRDGEFVGDFDLGLSSHAGANAYYDHVEGPGYGYGAAGLDVTIQLTIAATGAPAVLGRDFVLRASPSPFREGARLVAPATDRPCTISVFDAGGRLVRSWSHVVGGGEVCWDGSTAQGGAAPAGVYFIRADDGRKITSGKLVRLR